MTCVKPIKNISVNWLNMFSIKRKLTDDHIECMQFGICDYFPKKVKEFPFFHY